MGRWSDKYSNSTGAMLRDMEEEADVINCEEEFELIQYQRELDNRNCILFENFINVVGSIANSLHEIAVAQKEAKPPIIINIVSDSTDSKSLNELTKTLAEIV